MVYDASQEKIDHIYLLKINIHYCLDSSLYRAMYRCIVIHQRQYINMSTHCIVATLVYILIPSYIQYIVCLHLCPYTIAFYHIVCVGVVSCASGHTKHLQMLG